MSTYECMVLIPIVIQHDITKHRTLKAVSSMYSILKLVYLKKIIYKSGSAIVYLNTSLTCEFDYGNKINGRKFNWRVISSKLVRKVGHICEYCDFKVTARQVVSHKNTRSGFLPKSWIKEKSTADRNTSTYWTRYSSLTDIMIVSCRL